RRSRPRDRHPNRHREPRALRRASPLGSRAATDGRAGRGKHRHRVHPRCLAEGEVTVRGPDICERNGQSMKIRYFVPLIGFVVPTLVIGFGFIIPKSCIAGLNDLSIGFLSSVIGACITYWVGVRTVVRDQRTGPDATD